MSDLIERLRDQAQYEDSHGVTGVSGLLRQAADALGEAEQLAIAGAFIAAEIDRLKRLERSRKGRNDE